MTVKKKLSKGKLHTRPTALITPRLVKPAVIHVCFSASLYSTRYAAIEQSRTYNLTTTTSSSLTLVHMVSRISVGLNAVIDTVWAVHMHKVGHYSLEHWVHALVLGKSVEFEAIGCSTDSTSFPSRDNDKRSTFRDSVLGAFIKLCTSPPARRTVLALRTESVERGIYRHWMNTTDSVPIFSTNLSSLSQQLQVAAE